MTTPLHPDCPYPQAHEPPHDDRLYARGKNWVPLDDVRKCWKQWKQAWGRSDSDEAYALMEMDLLLDVDENGDPV